MIETVLSGIAITMTGIYAFYKIIKKVKKSNCLVEMADGTKYEIDFDDVLKTLESIDDVKEFSKQDMDKVKKAFKSSVDKVKSKRKVDL